MLKKRICKKCFERDGVSKRDFDKWWEKGMVYCPELRKDIFSEPVNRSFVGMQIKSGNLQCRYKLEYIMMGKI